MLLIWFCLVYMYIVDHYRLLFIDIEYICIALGQMVFLYGFLNSPHPTPPRVSSSFDYK